MRRIDNKGFTVIELLIATVIFSVVLLVLTGAVVQFGRVYYKGVLSSKTQDNTRNIMEDISRSIQFNGGDVTPITNVGGKFSFCAGARRYTFVKNTQVYTATYKHVLVADQCSGVTPDLTQTTISGATDLIGERMRIAELNYTRTGDLYTIVVRLAYGNNDLLELGPPTAAYCKTSIRLGGQFCATSELTTTIKKRVN